MSKIAEITAKILVCGVLAYSLFTVSYQSYLNRPKEEQNYKPKKISLNLESLVELTDSTIYKN